ncbi:MAG TPA: hypothetical protein VJ813_08700 [Vicinamibacterales bacterium]|nr:hypothetical protein [Vicinamibacterales bacterium]
MNESADYCREIEAYLCRKNGGHLVRIVGPAFEKVRAWAADGVPLKVAFRGIDRCCDRASARGGRRRPMRIEFCEADVLEAFDDWRRAIGVSATQVAEPAGPAFESGGDGPGPRKGSLAAHIGRSVSRLLAPTKAAGEPLYDEAITRITQALDELAVRARSARGETRARIIERLAALDAELVVTADARIDSGTRAALQAEADAELAGFAGRMPADSLVRARRLAFERLLREALNLPVLTYE